MKRNVLLFLVVVVAIIVSSCSTSETCLKSKKEVLSKSKILPYFDSIKFSSKGNLFISQGNENSIIIKAPKDIFEKIKTIVSDNLLTISCNEEICPDEVTIYLTFKDISSIKSFNGGNIYNITPIKSSSLDIFTKSGDIYLTDLKTNMLKVLVDEQSNVKLSGNSKSTLLENQGSGIIEAIDLNSKFVTANVLGSGNITTFVDYKLTSRISGTGELLFTGEPYETEFIREGLGNIKKLKAGV